MNGMPLRVPPLRERASEILEIFGRAFEQKAGVAPLLGAEAAEALLLHPWPFNAREVVGLAHRVATLHNRNEPLGLEHVAAELSRRVKPGGAQLVAAPTPLKRTRADCRAQLRRTLDVALRDHQGNLTRAARALGISRSRAYRLMGPLARSMETVHLRVAAEAE
jgi:DNA-binding NtrC family response regulator